MNKQQKQIIKDAFMETVKLKSLAFQVHMDFSTYDPVMILPLYSEADLVDPSDMEYLVKTIMKVDDISNSSVIEDVCRLGEIFVISAYRLYENPAFPSLQNMFYVHAHEVFKKYLGAKDDYLKWGSIK